MKDYCKANNMTGPEKLINTVNMVCRKLVANRIHGTIYFIDKNVETKHELLESSWYLEIVVKPKKVPAAYDVLFEIDGLMSDRPDKFSFCHLYFCYYPEVEAEYCPKMTF